MLNPQKTPLLFNRLAVNGRNIQGVSPSLLLQCKCIDHPHQFIIPFNITIKYTINL